MHYRNGREAKNGDRVIQLNYDTAVVNAVGVLHGATPGNNHCNGMIAPIQNSVQSACLCDCLHADDLAAILAEKDWISDRKGCDPFAPRRRNNRPGRIL